LKEILPCFRRTLSFLTRYPVPFTDVSEEAGPKICVAWFPLVGVLVGLSPAVADRVTASFPVFLGALVVVLVWTFVTGGIHWDGWADSIETALSGVTGPEKKRIRKDPHLGTFGGLALLSGFLVKVFAVAGYAFEPMDFVAVALWGRGILPLFLFLVRRMAPEIPLSDGLGGGFISGIGKKCFVFPTLATGTTLVFLLGIPGTLVLLAGLPLLLIPARWILLRQDAFSGDFIGFSVELLEMSSLIFLGILRSHPLHASLTV
jgi:adenosylcobinamide-GDP ribazoletransferase